MFIALVKSAKIKQFTQWLYGVTCENEQDILMIDNGDGADLDYADHHVHVATSLQPETSNSSDCVYSVSNYHAEFCTCSSSLMGVPFFEYGNSEKGSLNAKKMASRNIFQHFFCMNFFMFVLLISRFPTVFLVQFGINLHL